MREVVPIIIVIVAALLVLSGIWALSGLHW